MRLQEYLRPDFVIADMDAGDADGVVRAIAALAAAAGIGDESVIAEKLLERERLHPTVIGEGLAIPHATVPGLDAPVIGVAVPTRPIEYGDPSSDPVEAFFILLSPPGSETLHVKLLARICRLVRHRTLIERLESAKTAEQVLAVVQNEDALHP